MDDLQTQQIIQEQYHNLFYNKNMAQSFLPLITQEQAKSPSDFQKLIQNDGIFIDKTLFIQQIMNSDQAIIVVHRPPKWGKSLNLTMLQYYFGCNTAHDLVDIEKCIFNQDNQDTKNKLKGLKIMSISKQSTNFMKKSHPIIYLDFKDIQCTNIKQCQNMIINKINYYVQKQIKQLKTNTLSQVAKELQEKYKKLGCMVLIDNYCTPIEFAILNNGQTQFINDYIEFLQELCYQFISKFENRKIIITGTLNVWKKNRKLKAIICSLKKCIFSNYYGFHQKQIKQYLLCHKYNISEKIFQVLKQWHYGYLSINHKNQHNYIKIFHPYTSKTYLQNCIQKNQIVTQKMVIPKKIYANLFRYIEEKFVTDINKVISLIIKLQQLNNEKQQISLTCYKYDEDQYQIMKDGIWNQDNNQDIESNQKRQSFLAYLFYYYGLFTGTYYQRSKKLYALVPNKTFYSLSQQLLKSKISKNQCTVKDFSYIDIQNLQDVKEKFKLTINNWKQQINKISKSKQQLKQYIIKRQKHFKPKQFRFNIQDFGIQIEKDSVVFKTQKLTIQQINYIKKFKIMKAQTKTNDKKKAKHNKKINKQKDSEQQKSSENDEQHQQNREQNFEN